MKPKNILHAGLNIIKEIPIALTLLVNQFHKKIEDIKETLAPESYEQMKTSMEKEITDFLDITEPIDLDYPESRKTLAAQIQKTIAPEEQKALLCSYIKLIHTHSVVFDGKLKMNTDTIENTCHTFMETHEEYGEKDLGALRETQKQLRSSSHTINFLSREKIKKMQETTKYIFHANISPETKLSLSQYDEQLSHQQSEIRRLKAITAEVLGIIQDIQLAA